MARSLDKLSTAAVKAAKPGDRLPDGGGLRFEYRENGSRYWPRVPDSKQTSRTGVGKLAQKWMLKPGLALKRWSES